MRHLPVSLMWLALAAVILTTHLSRVAALGANRRWISSTDGSFQDPFKWLDRNIPGPLDTATFAADVRPATYIVTFSADVDNDLIAFWDDQNVTFQLNGNTYSVTRDVYCRGSLTVDGDGTLDAQKISHQGDTELVIKNGANVNTSVFRLWSGLLTIQGNGSTLTTSGDVTFSSPFNDPVPVTVVGGGHLRTGESLVGEHAQASVSGTNSLWQADSMEINQGSLTVGAGGLVDVTNELRVVTSTLAPQGGTVNADTVDIRGVSLVGFGEVHGKIIGDANSVVEASGGDFVIGDANRFDSLAFDGQIRVANYTVTLRALSYAELGGLTTIGGGTLRADNGVSLGSGNAISGFGTIDGATSSSPGSTIAATGSMTIGDSNSLDGVDLHGRLLAGGNTLTLDDRNQAVLGSLTVIEGGTLEAANGILLREGDNLEGHGTVTADFVTQGYVYGDDPELEFSGNVSGRGDFGGNVLFSGTYSPGNSPAQVDLENVAFANTATLKIELGGTEPGSEYDVLEVSATATLDGTLEVLLIDGFVPSVGDEFTIMTFSSIVDDFHTYKGLELGGGLYLEPELTSGSLILSTVPEPSTLVLLGMGAVGLLAHAWRKRRRC